MSELGRQGALFPVASQNLAGLEVDEVDSLAGEAPHRFIIVIAIRREFDAVLHVLVGYRAGEEYVFHSVPCGPAICFEGLKGLIDKSNL
jgi:hypothetical protein